MTRRTLLALVLSQLLALAAIAQSSEFARASGGSIDAITKPARRTSGSLTLTRTSGLREGRGYEATLGGELLEDRVWFFGAASFLSQKQFTFEPPAQPVEWKIPASFLSLTPAPTTPSGPPPSH